MISDPSSPYLPHLSHFPSISNSPELSSALFTASECLYLRTHNISLAISLFSIFYFCVEKNPPIQQVIESGVVSRFVQFLGLDSDPVSTAQFLLHAQGMCIIADWTDPDKRQSTHTDCTIPKTVRSVSMCGLLVTGVGPALKWIRCAIKHLPCSHAVCYQTIQKRLLPWFAIVNLESLTCFLFIITSTNTPPHFPHFLYLPCSSLASFPLPSPSFPFTHSPRYQLLPSFLPFSSSLSVFLSSSSSSLLLLLFLSLFFLLYLLTCLLSHHFFPSFPPHISLILSLHLTLSFFFSLLSSLPSFPIITFFSSSPLFFFFHFSFFNSKPRGHLPTSLQALPITPNSWLMLVRVANTYLNSTINKMI